MKKLWFMSTMGVVGGALFSLYCVAVRHAEADPIDAVLLQAPLAATIQQELASHKGDNPPMTVAQRQDLFADRFTERFRKNEPRMAVRAKFEEANHVRNRIKLMCPARMEPWNMDRVALSAWREAKDCLGGNYDVDLYETYIGSPPIKVGELRQKSGATFVADIHYLPRPQKMDSSGTIRLYLPSQSTRPRVQGLFAAPHALPGVPLSPVAALHP